MSRLSRKEFLRFAAASIVGNRIAGAGSDDQPRELVREFKDALLLALSPDGRKMCLHFTKNSTESFRLESGRWKRLPWNKSGEGLKVIELDTWKELFSVNPPGGPLPVTFFRDSERLITNTLLLEEKPVQQQYLLIDLNSGRVVERREGIETPFRQFYAYDGDLVIGTENGKTRKLEWYTHVSLPEWNTVKRVPQVPEDLPRPVRSAAMDGLKFSLDRRFFADTAGEHLLYRRCSDFGVVWTRVLDSSLQIWKLCVSANGDWVVAALNEPTLIENMKRWKVFVLEGRQGATVATLPVNGIQGVAISPDGKLLAVGEQERVKGWVEAYELWVSLYEIPSGKRVARLFHDRMPKRRGIMDTDFFQNGIQFTADGKYLVSGGRNTRIWRLPHR
jgi:hypothetical protein